MCSYTLAKTDPRLNSFLSSLSILHNCKQGWALLIKRCLHNPKIDSNRGVQISDADNVKHEVFVENPGRVSAKKLERYNICHCKEA